MHDITEKFRNDISLYESFQIKLESLFRELLIQRNINFHKIEARVKDPKSLDNKISLKNEKYKDISDVTDLIGIRIITYFEDEVDKVAKIIEAEFVLDKENSIDKRVLETDKFGYKSLHYVLSLSTQRKALTEYKRFANIKFEVQIRSILQHAWAEIEHDIGYKGEFAIPDQLKRSFFRVAALLEVADIEFVNIKQAIAQYESTVNEVIQKHPEQVDLNISSLRSFISNNSLVKKIDEKLSKESGIRLNEQMADPSYDLDRLHFLGIRTIDDLTKALKTNEENILKFASEWLGKSTHRANDSFNAGISIFYLCYILVGQKGDKEFATQYFQKYFRKDNKEDGNKIVDIYNKIKS